MPTENLLSYFQKNKIVTGIDDKAFADSMLLAGSTFPLV
jgi:hypothetical protein